MGLLRGARRVLAGKAEDSSSPPRAPARSRRRTRTGTLLSVIRLAENTLVAVAVIGTSACVALTTYGKHHTAATKAYQAGDLDTAVVELCASVAARPDYEPASSMLRSVAPEAYEKHRKAAEEAEATKLWDKAVAEYDGVQKLVALVSKLPGGYPVVDFRANRDAAGAKAAETHYAAGNSLIRGKKFKLAAKEFAASGTFVGPYKDAAEKYEQARQSAVKRIALLPFTDLTRGSSGLAIGDVISDKVVGYFMDSKPEFTEFVTRELIDQLLSELHMQAGGAFEAKSASRVGALKGVHSFVTGKVMKAATNESRVQSESGTNTVTLLEGKGANNPKVTAYWTKYWKEAQATTEVSYQIVDVGTGRIESQKTCPGHGTDVARWVEFRGDQRAVPSAVESFPNGKQETAPRDVLLDRAVEQASHCLADALRAHFE